MKRYSILFLVIGTAFILGMHCNSGTNPKPHGPLELLYPRGGQSFKVGDTIRIKWSIHDQSQVGSVGIKYSLSGGAPWNVNLLGPGSFTYPDTSYLWTVTSSYVSNSFAIKVYEYNENPPCDSSTSIIIHQ